MKKLSVKKPWGDFEQFTNNERSTVKILSVKKGQSISLQYHKKREEFWKVLKGSCRILIGEEETPAKKGDEFFIPKKANHRITAVSDSEVLEISFGNFDEKDIVRLKDSYDRI